VCRQQEAGDSGKVVFLQTRGTGMLTGRDFVASCEAEGDESRSLVVHVCTRALHRGVHQVLAVLLQHHVNPAVHVVRSDAEEKAVGSRHGGCESARRSAVASANVCDDVIELDDPADTDIVVLVRTEGSCEGHCNEEMPGHYPTAAECALPLSTLRSYSQVPSPVTLSKHLP